jgi:RNA polymerase sigma-70 factor (ECF subfamily)
MLGLSRQPTRVEPASDAVLARSDESRRVREVVAGLPPKDREVIVLFYLEHRGASEIAEMIGSSTNAVDVRLHRARQKLKVLLQDLAGAETHA